MTSLKNYFTRKNCWNASLLTLLVIAGHAGLPLLAQESETLAQIEVVGANKQTTDAVLYKAGIKVGDDLRNMDLTEVLQRLWSTNAFEDIKFEVEAVPGGKKLIIRVSERPVVRMVEYLGGTEVGLQSIKDRVRDLKLEIKPDSVYNPDAVRRIKEIIVDACSQKGFRNPSVEVDVESMGPGVVRVVFDIQEGGKAKISRIVFTGNKHVSAFKLRSVMKKTKANPFYSWLGFRKNLIDENLENDIKEVKRVYWQEGYKDVFIGNPIIEVEDYTTTNQRDRNRKRVKKGKSAEYQLEAVITIPVVEGERYYEGKLNVVGESHVFSNEKVKNMFIEKISKVRQEHHGKVGRFFGFKPEVVGGESQSLRAYDLDAINTGIDGMREEYENRAYVMFSVEKKMAIREEDGVKKVDTTIEFKEGDLYTVRRVVFEGNTTTKDKVLRRAMILKEGEPFRVNYLKESYASVGQLGFFNLQGNEPKVEMVGDKPEVDLTIKGVEAGTNEVMFQAGYGSVFGASVGGSYATRNLAGGGQSLTTSVNYGKNQKSLSLGYSEPNVFDGPYSFSAQTAYSRTDYVSSKVGKDNAYSQTQKSLGAAVGVRLNNYFPDSIWAHFTTYQIGFTFRQNEYSKGENFFYRGIGKINTLSLDQSLTYDTIDHPYKPTRGLRLSAAFNYAGWSLGTDRPNTRLYLGATKYYNINERHVFGLNASYGYINNMSKAGTPYFDYFKMGGDDSVRGYTYGQIGSIRYDDKGRPVVVGGNKQLVLNFEYQFKITEDIRAVVFYDAGNAWGPGEKMFNRDVVRYRDRKNGVDVSYKNPLLVQGYGLEVRFFLPFMQSTPMRLIWAKKRNPYPWDKSDMSDFTFSMGTTF